MTATGGNAGCAFWSHDVGGHMGGTGDPDSFGELYARWTQFGALSPVNRIHTSKMPFVDKRPWRFGGEVREALGSALRRRHISGRARRRPTSPGPGSHSTGRWTG